MDIYDLLGILSMGFLNSDKMRAKIETKPFVTEIKPIKFIYRPKYLTEYIGQEQAKDLVKMAISVILNTKPLHFLITGIAGMGKTTLAQIICNELHFNIYSTVGNALDKNVLQDFLLKNEDSKFPMILFIDEIHSMDKEILEFMLPIIEDFKLNQINITPFILIGATNEKTTLLNKSKPFVDRIQIPIILEDYQIQDIVQILKQYNQQIYQKNIDDKIYIILAENTRFNPRIAIALFDLYMGNQDIIKVLKAHRIIKNGLTDTDIKILNHLDIVNGKAIGEQALSVIANIERKDYVDLIEPYLIRMNLISRTGRGRILTEDGKKFLENLKRS